MPQAPVPRTRLILFCRIVIGALLAYTLVGWLLELSLGAGFIMAGSKAYIAAMPWVVAGLMTPIAALALLLLWSERRLGWQWRIGSLRWLANGVLFVALSALMLATAPWGWAALLGQLAGAPAQAEATVLSLDNTPSRRSLRRCDQRARLQFAGDEARLCLTGRLAAAGIKVTLTGRLSRWGLHVDQIDPVDEGRAAPPEPVKTRR